MDETLRPERPASPRPLSHYALLPVGAAVVTLLLKLASWQTTGSVGLLSDALESLANLAAAVVSLASVSIAARPADHDHAYGHTKAEFFAGGIEGMLVMLAAGGIGWSAMDRAFHPEPLRNLPSGIALAVAAGIINAVTAGVLLRTGRRRHSIALEAGGRHLMADVWTTVALLAGIALIPATGWLWLDPLLAILIALHVVVAGARLVHRSALGLMDTGLSSELLDRIRAILDSRAPDGVTWHALRTRDAGTRRFMSVHLLVPGEWTVARGHDHAERIEAELRKAVPGLTVITHLEPREDPASWQDTGLDRH